ncbi:MAG: peptidoglycan-binding protein [Candidatus Liptonbacteria bacterium]|nr:peptidoglycan-binding protein [Candidatus Liptonbacteria bacterium]
MGAAAMPLAAHGATTEELQAQITALLAQITQLQAQLSGATGGSTAPSTTFTSNLTVGSKGTDVKALQQFLNANGYAVAAAGAAGSSGNETTYFGPATKAAVAKYQAAKGISPAVGYFGPLTRSSVNAAGGTVTVPGTTLPGVVIPASGIAITLAGDNPAGKVLPQGAAGVEMLKFNVAGNGTVNSITMKRTGAGQTADFSAVYLYRGNERLTSGRTINSSTHEVNFASVNLSVSGATTLRLVGDISTTAAQGNYNAFQVSAVSASTSVSGVPVSGNQFSISGADAGTITATDQSDGLSNPNVGQSNAEMFRFKLTTASEDMDLKRVSVFYAGAVSKSNLSNFKLKDLLTGNIVATVNSISGEDLIVFDLTTPYALLKGDSRQFQMFADIAGGSRSGTAETLIFYFEEGSDIYAVGRQYGYGAAPTITDIDATADYRTNSALTLQSGNFIVSHVGPTAGDIAENGKDLNLFEFTIYSANNVEVRNLRFTVTASTTVAGVDDFKIVDVDSGVIVSGPKDDASGSVVMTDDFTLPAGVTKRFKVTGDTDTNWANNDTILVSTVAFTDSDLKNIDNNTFLTVSTDVVPSGAITGNTQTVKSPTLTVNLAALPSSDSFVKGTTSAQGITGVPFLGLNLQATADAIKVTSIKISASLASTTAANIAAGMQNVALYDGSTKISDIESWSASGTPRTITFSSLNYTIAKGQSKNLVVRANISSSATANEEWAVTLADSDVDITAIDSDGNSPTFGGAAAVNAAATPSVKVTILSGGSITVAKAADDTESKAGVVVAGTNGVVLGKFDFTASNETMTVNKLQLVVGIDATTSTTSTSLDDVVGVYLYDGGTLIGSSTGYIPNGSSGVVTVEGLGWSISKDTTKKLTVKANLNTIAAGADTGQEIRVHVIEPGFEATGSATTVTSLTGSPKTGNEKILFKGYPSLSTVTLSNTSLSSLTDVEVARFRVNANSNDVEWAQVGLQFTLSNASGSDATLTLTNVTLGTSVTVGTQVPTTSALDITGGTATNAILQLTTPEQISSGSYYEYSVKLSATAAQLGTANETETLSTKIVLLNDSAAASKVNGVAARTALDYANAAIGSDNAFVWSDRSATSHTLLTTDWANGVYVVEPDLLSSWVLTR